jgi:hypothetical protein
MKFLKAFVRKYTPKKPPCRHYTCRHYRCTTSFKDIHRGSEYWYVRAWLACECGWRKCVAIPVPHSLDLDGMDLDKYYNEVRAGKYQ